MSNFTQRTVTTKESRICAACSRIHNTGALVLMKFVKTHEGTETTILCNEFCLVDYKNESTPVNKLLDKLSVQFN